MLVEHPAGRQVGVIGGSSSQGARSGEVFRSRPRGVGNRAGAAQTHNEQVLVGLPFGVRADSKLLPTGLLNEVAAPNGWTQQEADVVRVKRDRNGRD